MDTSSSDFQAERRFHQPFNYLSADASSPWIPTRPPPFSRYEDTPASQSSLPFSYIAPDAPILSPTAGKTGKTNGAPKLLQNSVKPHCESPYPPIFVDDPPRQAKVKCNYPKSGSNDNSQPVENNKTVTEQEHEAKGSNVAIVLSIFVLIFFNLPVGLLAVIFAHCSGHMSSRGNLKASRYCTWLSVSTSFAGIILSMLIIIAVFYYFFIHNNHQEIINNPVP